MIIPKPRIASPEAILAGRSRGISGDYRLDIHAYFQGVIAAS